MLASLTDSGSGNGGSSIPVGAIVGGIAGGPWAGVLAAVVGHVWVNVWGICVRERVGACV